MKKTNNNRINVLHMFSRFSVGGAEKLLLELLTNAQYDKEINYIFLSLKDTVDEELIEEFKKLKIKFFVWDAKGNRKLHRIYKILRLIYKEKIDIIHTHDAGGKHRSMFCKIFKPNLKLVFTSHGNNDLAGIDKKHVFAYNLFVNKIIMISDYIKDACKKIGLKNTEFIYNGVDTKKFGIKTQRQFMGDPLKIIKVSRLQPHIKGQDVLIKALKICKDRNINFKCSIVGGEYDYTPNVMNELKELVAQNKLNEEIDFLGNRSDIPELLSESDLFVLASRTEAMPLVLLEAMASGMPVISSNIAAAKPLIKDGINGKLFESGNPEDLADKICELYNDREKMRQIAENGYKFVQDFDISVMVKKYHDVYRSVVKRK